jgi:pimeloyl-ACP methyl ester carboxylesterase
VPGRDADRGVRLPHHPEVGRRTSEQIKGAEFSEMEGIGHFPMSENYPVLRDAASRHSRR